MQKTASHGTEIDIRQALKRIEVIADDEGEIVEVHHPTPHIKVACLHISRQYKE